MSLGKLKGGLAVDIDETLSWTIGYWFRELRRLFGNPEGLSVQELITKYRYFQHVPYWQTTEALEWAAQKIYDNDLQKVLPLIKNSNLILNKVNKIIQIKEYLTIRPIKVVEGTGHWLVKHKFPKAKIVARPPEISREDGHRWKAQVLSAGYPKILGIIDDNPVLFDYLPKNYPGVVLLYDMKKFETDRKNVYSCPNWNSVLTVVKKIWGNER
jgi:hypothetical protein